MSDIYSQTAKGKAELAAKPGRLSSSFKKLLDMIGKRVTVIELTVKLPHIPETKLRAALEQLATAGYIETPREAASDNDLDFTRYFSRPVKEPTVQQKRQAEATLAGFRPSRKKAGYYVDIVNRPDQRILPQAGDKYTVLIIDGDEANALVMARALLLAKFDTRSATKGEEIIAELNKKPPPDAIAMDVALPDVIGLELLGRIREHPTFKSVPIIVMAANAKHDDVVAALAYGANGYMTKPFKPEALLENVKAMLGLG